MYEAFDRELHEKVALKTIRLAMVEDEEAETRFMREIHLARRVTHPNVCRIFDVFHHKVTSGNYEGEIRFLTMELLLGETLGKRLRREGRLSVERALPIAEQIASAVSAAHDVGIVHRDLKPDNVMLVPWKKSVRAVVTDFGLARGNERTKDEPLAAIATSREGLLWTLHGVQAGAGHIQDGVLRRLAIRARRQMAAFGLAAPLVEPLTEQGRVMGTPDYMSPEQVRGMSADERSDIWSYGVLVYEMFTGELPYRRGTSWGRLFRRLSGRKPLPGRLRGVPSFVRNVVFRCLELDRRERYSDFEEIVGELRSGRIRGRRVSKRSLDLRLVGVAAGFLTLLLIYVLATW